MNKRLKQVLIILAAIFFVWLLFYLEASFTGRVTEECREVEVCENVTIENCVDICFEVCENITSEKCEIVVLEECSEECVEIDNETVCEEVCVDVESEECSEVVDLVCKEVCEGQNCTEEVIENCTIETVCEEILVINETEEVTEEEGEKVSPVEEAEKIVEEPVIDEEPVVDEEIVPLEIVDEFLNLTESEKNSIKLKTGENSVLISRSEIIGSRLILKFEIGDYWIEKSYDISLEKNVLNSLIENDRIRFLKKIGTSQQSVVLEKREEYLGEYEI